MPPVFILVSMTILGASTIMGVFTNSLIITVNIFDKVMGKALSPSDLILVTMGANNVLFQFIMLANDFLSFLNSDLYFSDEIYTLFTIMLNLPIYSNFWFTVCLSVNYCLQIVIFTNPLFIRIKFAVSQIIPHLLLASFLLAMATGVPAAWNLYKDTPTLNISSNETEEIIVSKLNVYYFLTCNLVSCSLPLILVAVANGMIIKSLVTNISDKNVNGELSARAQGRIRAARTISCLLLLYIFFYIAEILMFIDAFPPSSPGFCVCLIIIYSYSPSQSIVLIFGSPRLKQVSLDLLNSVHFSKKRKTEKSNVMFIKLKLQK
ncbi:PREDICTED: taste receptor type 2 member 40-like [Nanorana parkeri]|uniref:taste receptor type 2 member 40-like n=1 Tax=Nanorana parkeri TaxID=125878 RepID=UPI000854284E|nr:PREDICTED: taste receptor type 2 member 40-like [Nanorana parkeri]